jgi:hypothetical protein
VRRAVGEELRAGHDVDALPGDHRRLLPSRGPSPSASMT